MLMLPLLSHITFQDVQISSRLSLETVNMDVSFHPTRRDTIPTTLDAGGTYKLIHLKLYS